MPASFDDPQQDRPKPPPHQSEIKDENLSTLCKIGGSGCVAACLCGSGIMFFVIPLMFASFGFSTFVGLFALIGLVCIILGGYAGIYGWRAAEKGSQW